MATPTTLPSTFVAGSVLTAAEMNALRGGFRILQVESTAKTDTFSTTSTTFTDLTGLSVSITPTSSSSQILVLADVKTSNATNVSVELAMVRDSTQIYLGDAAGNRARVMSDIIAYGSVPSISMAQHVGIFLDSPATTSATTYKIQILTTSGTAYVNRSGNDSDFSYRGRGASSITVMEVSA